MADEDPASPDATPPPAPRPAEGREEEEEEDATPAEDHPTAAGGTAGGRGTATQAEEDDLAGDPDGDDDDADPLADQSEFESLKQALLNERIAPEILDYRAELVARVSAVLDHQDSAIADLEQRPGGEPALRRGALALERDRLRFLLKSYLRARAHKIQAGAAPILDSRRLCARLAPGELRLANDCFVASGRLMKAAVLDGLPANYRSLVRQFEGEPGKRLLSAPDARRFVFCRALRDLGAVADGERGETLDMSAGDLHVVRYASVADLVRRDQACLL